MCNQNNYSNMLDAISLVIGLQNLYENREQSRHNDVQSANDSQARYLLSEINKRFDEQNQILERQNVVLERLLQLLEEKESAEKSG